MEEMLSILRDVFGLIYHRELLVFSLAAMIMAILVMFLDFIGTKLTKKNSLLKVSYENTPGLQFLLWGGGAIIAAYVGGLVEIFNIQSPLSMLIVGAAWPTVLPRILELSTTADDDEQEDIQEDIGTTEEG